MTAAYLAGYDCGKNGSNEINSHFQWFTSKEKKDDWERGKAAGMRGDKIPEVPGPDTNDVLTQPEVMAIVLALHQSAEDFKGTLANTKLPWNPESRATLKEILHFTQSALAKMTRLGEMGKDLSLKKYDYDPKTDNEQFFTKES